MWRANRDFGSFKQVSSLEIEASIESILKSLTEDTFAVVSMGQTCFSLGRWRELVALCLDFAVFLTDCFVSIRIKSFVTSRYLFWTPSVNESLINLSSSAIQILTIIPTVIIEAHSMIVRH